LKVGKHRHTVVLFSRSRSRADVDGAVSEQGQAAIGAAGTVAPRRITGEMVPAFTTIS